MVRAALGRGVHVATANEAGLAFAYRELRALAAEEGVGFFFEGAVIDGAAVHAIEHKGLPVTTVKRMGRPSTARPTASLTRLEQGASRSRSRSRRCRPPGSAEADPTHDVDGWDGAAEDRSVGQRPRGEDKHYTVDVDGTTSSRITIAEVRGAV